MGGKRKFPGDGDVRIDLTDVDEGGDMLPVTKFCFIKTMAAYSHLCQRGYPSAIWSCVTNQRMERDGR